MLDAFVQSGGLLNHQFESFNRFVPDWLIHMIKENSTTEVVGEKNSHIKHKIEFKDVLIKKPIHFENDGNFTAITPRECRLRKLTYQCSVYVDVVHSIYNLNEKDEKGNPYMFSKKTLLEVPLCQIPVLVRSDSCRLRDTSSSAGECPLDDGGYFIINGNEKVCTYLLVALCTKKLTPLFYRFRLSWVQKCFEPTTSMDSK
jgi:DNA-directed RNA polymerase beta subunit